MLSVITRLSEEERCGRVGVDEILPAADFLTRRSEVHLQSTRPRTRQPPPLHRTKYPQRDSPSTVDSLSPARPRRPSMRRRIRPARRRRTHAAPAGVRCIVLALAPAPLLRTRGRRRCFDETSLHFWSRAVAADRRRSLARRMRVSLVVPVNQSEQTLNAGPDLIGYFIDFDLNGHFVARINNSFDDRALSDLDTEALSDSEV
ncbi:hypothetical protein HETIRDRAFT_452738 [Heterobasidion irregulare TC 32-1]|uniref:Uncharacterized protein n=1 Tax=Heterobasidion irregulare (strain TC 32-1) TaxID=747525 RepID=W4K1L7_HETIT|nr:uncharacterized protein HETIRDRAFT_452738 [Heterobasidion irregulare TC 32-1]ETW79614.1 hypothetical protein HETIRDRAFT_452738 [Heterobasidion irregulare TC 32-1]